MLESLLLRLLHGMMKWTQLSVELLYEHSMKNNFKAVTLLDLQNSAVVICY